MNKELKIAEEKAKPKNGKGNITMVKNGDTQMASKETLDSFLNAGWKKAGE